jgi:hypothetical protein
MLAASIQEVPVTVPIDPDKREDEREDEVISPEDDYSPPTLIELGSHRDLTQTGLTGFNDGGCSIGS